ncbi:MAG: hypothetical protein VKJ24_02300 [Synechococcales bacterium]|nr:hypothetical protein [Synechococcales bacterium]
MKLQVQDDAQFQQAMAGNKAKATRWMQQGEGKSDVCSHGVKLSEIKLDIRIESYRLLRLMIKLHPISAENGFSGAQRR